VTDMAISSLGTIDLGSTISNVDSSITSSLAKTEESSFDSIFESAVNLLNDTQKLTNQAEEEEMKYALGYDNTLELMVAQNKANTAISYVVAIRDKVLEAYNEIMNMQF
jgi:flagellar hook-basal body complex protein FliE